MHMSAIFGGLNDQNSPLINLGMYAPEAQSHRSMCVCVCVFVYLSVCLSVCLSDSLTD